MEGFGVVYKRNAFFFRILYEIASGDYSALAMTSQESHCESAVADAAVSVQVTHEGTEFLRRRSNLLGRRACALRGAIVAI